MSPKKRLHELARELDVTTDRLMDIALRHGMRFSSNFNAVEPEQEEKLRTAVLGPIRKQTKPIVKIIKTAKQKAKEAEELARAEEAALVDEDTEISDEFYEEVSVAETQESIEVKIESEVSPEEIVEQPSVEPEPEEIIAEPVIEKVKIEPEKEMVEAVGKFKQEIKPEKSDKESERISAKVVEDKKLPEKITFKSEVLPTSEKKILPVKTGPKIEERPATPSSPDRKKKRRRKKSRDKTPVLQASQSPTPGKKRAKMPSAPSVDHVMLTEGMTIKDLAEKLGIKAKDIIQKLLLEKGVMANINHVLDVENAKEIATAYGVTSEEVSFEEEIALEEELKFEGESVKRAPVVTIMGHVDHGKTTLLDYIRKSSVAEGEHGGITQHIGAYKVEHNNNSIVFLDTPGHEAFTRLRARGAKVTDIVILIVAADDGVMPQTIESIQHARAANVPMIVAITKIDRPQANIDKVKKQLADRDILLESWGGDVVSVEVSGITGEGVEELLEMILLVAEMQNLTAYPEIKGMGNIIEAKLDRARGPVATVLIQNGFVTIGDFFIAGVALGKIKAMFDDKGEKILTAGPSTPLEILGFNEVPESGDQFQIVEDETKARQMASFRHEQLRESQMASSQKLSLDDLFAKISEGDVQELPLIIKGDVKGSVEALSESLEKLSTDLVKINIILSQPGAITESDVLLATASTAIIIGFNVRAQKSAQALAEKEGIEIRNYNVIYETIKDVKDAMRGMLAPTFREIILGKAEVRQTFKVPKIGLIAGCYVLEGLMRRSAGARLIRDDIVIWEGRVGSLKRFKEDTKEVKTGFECGIGLDGQQDVRENDIIEMYTKEEVAAEL